MILAGWRIYKAKYSAHAFDGEGARQFGGRFNSVGTPAVYVASSISLAVLEMLVHLNRSQLLQHYRVRSVSFDDSLMVKLDLKRLPRDWRSSPPSVATQQIGDEWVARATSAVLQVPSAIVQTEVNFVLNPHHPDFRRIRIGDEEDFEFPPRLAHRR